MREIKFRAWHESAEQMIYPDEHRQSDVLKWMEEGQPVIVMQFTGLKDRNGKEIYEGDVVIKKDIDYSITENWEEKDSRWEAPLPENEVDRDLVTLERFRFWLKNESFGYEGEDMKYWSEYEVIGNIHDNPELL